jgi:hypothetical protein
MSRMVSVSIRRRRSEMELLEYRSRRRPTLGAFVLMVEYRPRAVIVFLETCKNEVPEY